MKLHRLAVLGLVPAAVAAAPATAAAPVVKLDLKGAYATKVMRGCAEKSTHTYAYFRARGRIRFTGRISPAPRRGAKVKIKLKKCVGGRNFNTLRQFNVRTGAVVQSPPTEPIASYPVKVDGDSISVAVE